MGLSAGRAMARPEFSSNASGVRGAGRGVGHAARQALSEAEPRTYVAASNVFVAKEPGFRLRCCSLTESFRYLGWARFHSVFGQARLQLLGAVATDGASSAITELQSQLIAQGNSEYFGGGRAANEFV